MPTYDYKCPKCQSTFELSSNYDGREFCGECGAEMERQVSKPAVHFKGTGFYETDYKGKN